jgi:hypothetical protein
MKLLGKICLLISLTIVICLAIIWFLRNFFYVWLINQPYPFSQMGSGPFMVRLILVSAIIFFFVYFSWDLVIKARFQKLVISKKNLNLQILPNLAYNKVAKIKAVQNIKRHSLKCRFIAVFRVCLSCFYYNYVILSIFAASGQ